MRNLRVSFVQPVPDHVTDEQAMEWLRFELGENGLMQGGNPMSDAQLSPVAFSVEIEEL
jgi:hypothetical protein